MNKVEQFKLLLKLRTIFKQLTQLSWNITALEKRYPLEKLTEVEESGLLSSYQEYAKDIKRLNDELKKELNEEEKR